MNPLTTIRTAGAVVGEVLRLVFVEPVRDGRLRAAGWPPGLAAVVAVAGAGFVLAAALVVAAPAVRRSSGLEVALGGSLVYPRWTTALFFGLVVLTLALLHAASLHLSPWLRVATLAVVVLAVLNSSLDTWADNQRANVVAMVGAGLLVLLTAARWRAAFGWWEPVASFLVIGATVALAARFVGDRVQPLGFDTTPATLAGTMQLISALAVPFTFVAGLAFAQLALLMAQRVGGVVDERVRNPAWVAAVVAALAGLALLLAVLRLREPTSSGVGHAAELLASGVLLAAAVGGGLALLRTVRAEGRLLDEFEGAVSRLALPVGFAVAATFLVALVIGRVSLVLLKFDQASQEPFQDAVDALIGTGAIAWTRLAAGVLLVGWAVWQRSRHPVVALLAATIGGVLAYSMVSDVTGHRVDPAWTTEAVTDLATVAAVVTAVVLAVTRRLDRRRLVVLGTALGLSVAFGVRSSFDAPFVALFGLGAAAALFLGVVWATLTDGDDANADSLRYPRPARVLFFLANALLAMTTLAFVSVADTTGLGIDNGPIGTLGDSYLGTGLLLAAYAVLVRELVSPPAADPRRSPAS